MEFQFSMEIFMESCGDLEAHKLKMLDHTGCIRSDTQKIEETLALLEEV